MWLKSSICAIHDAKDTQCWSNLSDHILSSKVNFLMYTSKFHPPMCDGTPSGHVPQ